MKDFPTMPMRKVDREYLETEIEDRRGEALHDPGYRGKHNLPKGDHRQGFLGMYWPFRPGVYHVCARMQDLNICQNNNLVASAAGGLA